jgi:hypothetical protein
LVSYYQLDEGDGGNVGDSVGANPGTWQGTLGNQWAPGIINGGGSFNGIDNYVDLGDLPAPPAMSVSVWLYPGAIQPWTDYLALSKTTNEYHLGIQAGAVEHFQAAYAGTAVADTEVDFARAASQGAWYHYVVTADPAAHLLTLYRNGAQVAIAPLTTMVGDTTTHAWIGRDPQRESGTFRGVIDELGIWERALSPAEAAQLYNGGAGRQYPFN